jgi:hypothetical protein
MFKMANSLIEWAKEKQKICDHTIVFTYSESDMYTYLQNNDISVLRCIYEPE